VLLSLQGKFPSAILALADGTVFIGNSIGATGTTVGEVVFNTSITGYQEILTDPSYCQQIVTLTYPHIGNYGVNTEDIEADKVHAAGLIIKDLPLLASNFRQTETLSQYLVREQTVAIANIDTRKLTRLLRSQGAQNGAIVGLAAGETVTQAHIDAALAAAKAAPSMKGLDLAQVVTTAAAYPWEQTEWKLGTGYGKQESPRFHVVAYDFGVKLNILRMLARARLQTDGGACPNASRRSAGNEPRRRVSVQRPWRPGALRLRHHRGATDHREWRSYLWHLPGSPDHGPGLGAGPSRCSTATTAPTIR
jgi:carbamoyl-phosphate synthase small subunit